MKVKTEINVGQSESDCTFFHDTHSDCPSQHSVNYFLTEVFATSCGLTALAPYLSYLIPNQ